MSPVKNKCYWQSFIINEAGDILYTGYPGSGNPSKWIETNRRDEGVKEDRGRWVFVVIEEMDDGTFRRYY